ncbi:MAG TPA: hypothetical protein VJX66_12195, partial [Amycolatopsis sp.]|nr:hypothetical protein [Amycolatopsis sp.]
NVTGGSLAIAALTDPATGRSWFGLHATAVAGHLAGPGVSADVSAGEVKLNKASGTGATALNWTQIGLTDTGLNLSGPAASVAADISNLDVFKVVGGGASFSVTEEPISTSAPNQVLSNAPLLFGSITISPAKHQELTLGNDAFGIHVTAAIVNFAVLSDPASDHSWLGLSVSGLSAAVVAPQVNAGVTNGFILLNHPSGTGTPALNWTDTGLADAGLTMKVTTARVGGDINQIDVFGVVRGSASFSVGWSLVTTTDPSLTDASLLTGSLSVDPTKNQQLQLGTSGFGITLTDGTINLASLTDPAPKPTEVPRVLPVVVQPGPRVDVITTAKGGKGATVQVLRTVNANATLGQVETLTVLASAGSFTLRGASGDVPAGLVWNASSTAVQAAVAGLASVKALTNLAACGTTCVTVAPMSVAPEGNVYTITFDASLSNVPTLTTDASQLVARNEQQQISVWNANAGTFTITDGAHSATIKFDLSDLSTALASMSADVKIAGDPPGTAPHNGFFTVEFNGASVRGAHVNPLVADPARLTGALNNGQLAGDVHFGATIFNNPSSTGVISRQGAAAVNIRVVDPGSATANGVQAYDVSGAVGGYYQLQYSFGTIAPFIVEVSNPISAFASAAEVESILADMPLIGGPTRAHNVSVSQTGSTYVVVFVGALSNRAINPLTWADAASNHLIAQDQQQIFQILNATSGSFTLSLGLQVDGSPISVFTNAINYPATSAAVKAALEAALTKVTIGGMPLPATATVAQVGTTYIVDFNLSGPLDANAHDTSFDNIQPIAVDRQLSAIDSNIADCGSSQPGGTSPHWALIPGIKTGTLAAATSGLTSIVYTAVNGDAPVAGDVFVIDTGGNQEQFTANTVTPTGTVTKQNDPKGPTPTFRLDIAGLIKNHAGGITATAAAQGQKLGVFSAPVKAGDSSFLDSPIVGGQPFVHETLILDTGLGVREPVIVSAVQTSGSDYLVTIIGQFQFKHAVGALVSTALDPTTLEGTVTYSKLAWDDTFWDHYAGDGNFFVYPDANFVQLLANPGNWDHGDGNEKGRIEVEWDRAPANGSGADLASGAFPTWALPVVGDWVHVVGALICDCGHPEGGFRSEIHPPRLLMTLRDAGTNSYGGAFGTSPGTAAVVPGYAALGTVQTTRADIFGSSVGSKARLQENCFLPIFAGVPGAVFGKTNPTDKCLNKLDWYQPLAFDENGQAAVYHLFVPAPAKPAGNFNVTCASPHSAAPTGTDPTLPVDVIPARHRDGTSVISVTVHNDPLNPGCDVTIDFRNFDEPPSYMYGVGTQVYAFWNKAVTARHVRVVFDSYTATHTLTNGDWSISALVNDQFSYEMQPDSAVSNGWSKVCMPYNTGVTTGQSYPITNGTLHDTRCGDFTISNSIIVPLLPGQPLRVFARAVQYQIFDPALFISSGFSFGTASENKELGMVEHVFTAAENYGIGRSYGEVFQDQTSSGNEARFRDCGNGCGYITFHIEDADLAVQPPAIYHPKRFVNFTQPPSKMVVNVTQLRNTLPLGTINVTLPASATQSFTSPEDLALALQNQTAAALLQAGLTPGFTTTGPLAAGQTYTAQQTPYGAPVFVPQGNHIHFGQTGNLSCDTTRNPVCDNPVNGALSAVVAHPNTADVLWVGSVNGGIWRTQSTAGVGITEWQPLLDLGPSLSISALAIDPTVAPDPTSARNAVLVAGFGVVSSFSAGGALAGLIRTIDGGDTWTPLGSQELAGQKVMAIAPRGSRIVVATQGTNGGVWRSVDTGATFYRVSGNQLGFGLPAGDAFDLVGDPGNNGRLYAAISGSGVYTSADFGATWTATGGPANVS